jgi:hypothetical protein
MMITETSMMTFAPLEDILSRMLFGWQQQFPLHEKESETKPSSSGSSAPKPTADTSNNIKKKHTKKTE